MHTYTYIWIQIYICLYTYLWVYIYVCVYICPRVCMPMFIYTNMFERLGENTLVLYSSKFYRCSFRNAKTYGCQKWIVCSWFFLFPRNWLISISQLLYPTHKTGEKKKNWYYNLTIHLDLYSILLWSAHSLIISHDSHVHISIICVMKYENNDCDNFWLFGWSIPQCHLVVLCFFLFTWQLLRKGDAKIKRQNFINDDITGILSIIVITTIIFITIETILI